MPASTPIAARLARRAFAAAVSVLAVCTGAPPSAAQTGAPTAHPHRPLVFIPGMYGSRLCRPNPANPAEPIAVWGTLGTLSRFSSLRIVHTSGAIRDDVKPCGLIREVAFLGLYTQEVYGPIIKHLERLGYREGRDLFVFDYDWRRSVFDNAEALADFVRERVPDTSGRVDILAHSMGGLVARVYAVKLGGGARIAQLLSAGTPFLGSVKVFESIESGWGSVANYLFGGVATFRRSLLSFPSVFELMARYGACCDGGVADAPAFAPSDVNAWRALRWEGVDPEAMPDLAATFSRVRELAAIVDTPLPAGVEDVMLIGVDQRTPQRFGLERRGDAVAIRMQTTWGGDGTVPRESATIPRAMVYPTSFADHQRILNDPQMQQFIGVALTRGPAEAIRTVPVRPRSQVRTTDGRRTQLVGVAVVPDQSLYRAGDAGRVHVHVRLATQQPLPVEALRLALLAPDGRATPIALRPDPAGSDPTNPFEQSFAGELRAGAREGTWMLRATVAVAGAAPRIVEHPIAVILP